MSTGNTPSGSVDRDRTLRLPESMRDELKVPLGEVLTGEAFLEAMRTARCLVTVGDVVTAAALEGGLRPSLAVVDFKIERRADRRLEDLLEGRVVAVDNPPGTITPALCAAITEAFKSGDPVTVKVAGEEDLAALVCVAEAPLDAAVVYGQPGEGAVVVTVTDGARRRAKDILGRMERLDGN